MEQVIRELEHVRRMGRLMLILQRVAQWVTAVVGLMLVLALLDYGLRLPGWIRLTLGLIAAISAIGWLVTRLPRAARFNPSLPVLALRAERAFPQLAGMLASGIEFATHRQALSQPTAGPATQVLADHSINAAMTLAAQQPGRSLRTLLKGGLTTRYACTAAGALLLLSMLVLVLPEASLLAARRWVDPLDGAHQWPKRTQVHSRIARSVWPIDTPIVLEAQVKRGYRAGMRVVAHYRLLNVTGDPGLWQEPLMSEQADGSGRFERVVDLAQPGGDPRQAGTLEPDAAIEFYFTAGDDQTQPQRIALVQRPALRAITAAIDPPAYASPYVDRQTVALHEKPGQIADTSALVGSTIHLRLELNKPIPADNAHLAMLAPGLADIMEATVSVDPVTQTDGQPDRSVARAMTISFKLDQTRQTAIKLVDEHKLSSQSERLYAIQAIADKPPAVSIVEPAADESVLPTAVVALQAVAQDDVAVDTVQLQAQRHSADAASAEDEYPPQALLEQVGRSAQTIAALPDGLDLTTLQVVPGDKLALTGIARDVFELSGQPHAPVVSTPRVLRIIDPATLIGQVRNELAGLRQQALRLHERQVRLFDPPAEQARPQQRQLTGHLDAQAQLLDRLEARLDRNRLNESDGGINQIVDEAGRLVDEARQASEQARQLLEQQQREQARRQQEATAESLNRLVTLLDQGRDALALELQLRQIATQQEHLLAQTRQALPETIGQSPEELSADARAKLEDLEERQDSLAEHARNLLQQMQATADVLSRSADNPNDQATAQALSQAAAIAQRQGLAQTMQQAAGNVGQNQLSQASQEQEQSLAVVRDMLRQLQEQDQRRQEILARHLAQLREALERIIKQQEQQIATLDDAADDALPGLEPGMARLRRNTMSVEEMARATEPPVGGPPGTGRAADYIELTTQDQSQAIVKLRHSARDEAGDAEDKALSNLNLAMEIVTEAQRRQQEEQRRQQRQELREAYERLAVWQDQLIEQTGELSDRLGEAAELTRPQRAEVIGLGHAEEDLRIAADELGRKTASVGGGPVFEHLHTQVSDTARRAVTRLHAAHADAAVIDAQTQVARMLRDMATALEEDPQRPDFAQGGGGGAGGGAGGQPPLVPPTAELKLLKTVQEAINQATRQLAQGDQADRRQLLRLSATQRELAGVGQNLIQKMQQGAP